MKMPSEIASKDANGNAFPTGEARSSEWLPEVDESALVGLMENISIFFEEVSEIERMKLRQLSSSHAIHVRRVKRDGCCFYRGYMFGLFEYFVAHKDEINPFIHKIETSLMNDIKSAGYGMETTEDFIREVIVCLRVLANTDSDSKTLETIFNDDTKSNYIVVFARLLTATYMKLNAPLFEPFLTSHSSVEDFCAREVDPMWVAAEQLQITALTTILSMPVEIFYVDQSPGKVPSRHVFPESPYPKIHLIYRPGHYDIIYP